MSADHDCPVAMCRNRLRPPERVQHCQASRQPLDLILPVNDRHCQHIHPTFEDNIDLFARLKLHWFYLLWIRCRHFDLLYSVLSRSYTLCTLLPVLRMTSCFHTMGPISQNQARPCLEEFARWRYQLDVIHYSVWLSSSECGTGGGGVAICDYLVADLLWASCAFVVYLLYNNLCNKPTTNRTNGVLALAILECFLFSA